MKYNISQEEIFKSQDYKCICNRGGYVEKCRLLVRNVDSFDMQF